jgi:hypothetical protein
MAHKSWDRWRRRGLPAKPSQASASSVVEVVESQSPLAETSNVPSMGIPWVPVLYVSSLAVFAAWYMFSSLFRSWYFSSDEYVIVAEVIRFLHFDFRQHFFDMPGTPLMFLAAIAWCFIYLGELVAGAVPRGAGLEWFTFHHLPLLFILMRAITLFFALVSISLVFILASKVTNRAGASVAALLVIMSPTYTSYSSFIRVESLAMCLVLASILAMLRALQGPRTSTDGTKSEVFWILLSGFLAGLAAATRFHSITASFPLLLLLMFFAGQAPSPYPKMLVRSWNYLLRAGFLVTAAGAIGIRTGYLPNSRLGRDLIGAWPLAFQSLYPLLLTAAILLGAILGLRRIVRIKPVVDRYLHARILVLATGCSIGCLVGTPTILWQYRYFLGSINAYSSGYFDHERATWPLLKNIAWFLKFYLQLIAPDNFTLALLAVGTILILVRRDRLAIPFLAVSALFFVSKPINLIAAPHHIIMWLPFYGIVAGYGVAKAYEAVPRSMRHARVVRGVGLALFLVVLGLTMIPGPMYVQASTRATEYRMHDIGLATDWAHQNTEPNAVVAISYFAFNSDVFYAWLKYLGVPEPNYIWDGRRYLIWWGDRPALKGLKGYAIVTPQELRTRPALPTRLPVRARSTWFSSQSYLEQWANQISQGQGTGSIRDGEFQRIMKFGTEPNEVDVYRFELTESPKVQ